MKNLIRALSYFGNDKRRLAVVLLLLLASTALNALKPWPLAIIVDSILGSKPLPHWIPAADNAALLILLSIAVLVLHVGQGAFTALQNFISIKVGLRGLTRVRNQLFSKLEQLSLRFYHGRNSGDLIYRASWDTYSFQTLFQQGLVTFVTAFLSLMIIIIVMAQMNLRLTLLALAVVPLLVAAIRFFGRKMNRRTTAAQQADSSVTSFLQQSIAAMQLIQSCTREDSERKRFGERATEAERSRVDQHGAELVYWFAIAAVFGIATSALVWLGANEVLAGKLSIGQLLVFIAYIAQLFEPLNQLSHVGATVSGALAGTCRVFEILDAPEPINDPPHPRSIAAPGCAGGADVLSIRGAISVENVSFSYEPGRPVLREISFTIQPGESVALVGPSGAGKTTLLNLLPRFFDPANGAIKLDGVDLRELSLKDLRRQIALVLQQPILLPESVAENIAYGKDNATAAEIESAARAANAHEFIERLPKKYDTVIGDGAARLSLGEQQRLNLARAFLKDAPILLLDEPTSSLDAENEELISATLQKLMHGRTTIIVAHRREIIRHVTRVFALENGRLVTRTPAPSPR